MTRTIVRLWDINGTRGGVDKACRVVVWLRGRGTIVVEAVDRDLYAAIDAAAAKLRERRVAAPQAAADLAARARAAARPPAPGLTRRAPRSIPLDRSSNASPPVGGGRARTSP